MLQHLLDTCEVSKCWSHYVVEQFGRALRAQRVVEQPACRTCLLRRDSRPPRHAPHRALFAIHCTLALAEEEGRKLSSLVDLRRRILGACCRGARLAACFVAPLRPLELVRAEARLRRLLAIGTGRPALRFLKRGTGAWGVVDVIRSELSDFWL